MDKELRNTLRNTVTKCRKLLEEAIGELLQGRFGIHADGTIEDSSRLTHLSPDELRYREEVLAHLEHIKASGLKPNDATAQLIREAAFTHLNRLCAYKMMADRGLMQDPVGRGLKSRGFLFYLADHPEDETLYNSSQQDLAFRHYLEWINDSFALEIGVLFAREDVATPLFPPHRVVEEVLELINSPKLQLVWAQDETIGWIFQYFTPKEMRDKARKESAAPRNSYEMSFRNQFFTPRYVVEFLVDNTLGRTWYEMQGGDTILKDKCRYLVQPPADASSDKDQKPTPKGLRAKKDPRDIKVLDPACGSGHFLLYCFDLFQTIYQEAYLDPELGPKLQQEFSTEEEYRRQVPSLILAHNLHGIDIDLRVIQLAALALWLRAQRAYHEIGLKSQRPTITRMNLVCAEPMPGEQDLLEEFIAQLVPHALGRLIGDLVRQVFERMKLAGEAGALVRIEDDIREPIEQARKQWQESLRQKVEREEELARKGVLFDYEKEKQQQMFVFDLADITDERVWHDAESEVLNALSGYARQATNGKGLSRKLFADDTVQGFAFIEMCRQKFDVVLMNPPFGDASVPSKPYIDEVYGDTKGDVYKAFVECFQDRLVPSGFLGIISSRTGFFLSGSSDWRERIVLRLYRPLVLADFGFGVLDAMVETAAYVLRSLTSEEDYQLTLQLAKDLSLIPTDKNDIFSTKKYEVALGLKRHQANGELQRLHNACFIKPIVGHFPRWSPLHGQIEKAPLPSNESYPSLICLRLLGEEDKESALYTTLHHNRDPRRFDVAPEDFCQVPNAPFCYWVSNRIRKLFVELPPLESNGRTAKQGIATADDFRFVRNWWEVSPSMLCKPLAHPERSNGAYCVVGSYEWFPFAKGGAFSPYYSDLNLVVNWQQDGYDIRNFIDPSTGKTYSRPQNTDFIFREGLTWSDRTTRFFSARTFPAGSVFSVKGSAGFFNADNRFLLGLMNTLLFNVFLSLMVGAGDAAARSYQVGTIGSVPFPSKTNDEERSPIETAALEAEYILRSLDTTNEISHVFHLPALLQVSGTLTERLIAWQLRVADSEQRLSAHQREIDEIAFRLYSITDEDRRAIEASVTRQPSPEAEGEKPEMDDEAEHESASTDQRQLTAEFISYAVGCAFGRWDVRIATGERSAPELPDPFAPLPVCAPGALTSEDGVPLNEVPADYPLRVDADGILGDDLAHTDDLLASVREVFELVWSRAAEVREREVCELLGVKTLRDYFRKPAAGGFWTDHVKRYSRSRRKAPIYWYLRSLKGNYGLWLYYHRLDKDILYKALLNYVEPKLHLEENNLAQLKQRREAVGTTGREGKQLEKDLDKQESFISELYDFRDKLKRAADLNLEPDLNDGVVLNIAPLWELVPWKEAEKYWKELIAGKYEWSSIAKQLRERVL